MRVVFREKITSDFSTFLCYFRYPNDYDPYERPESNVGFIHDGHAIDGYGRPVSRHGGRNMGGGGYDSYMNGGSNPDDDYDFGYSGYGH